MEHSRSRRVRARRCGHRPAVRLGIPFAAGAVRIAPSRHGAVRQFLQRPLLGARPAALFCFIRRAREPISRFKLFYDTMPAGTKYFIFEYYGRGCRRTWNCSSNCFQRIRSDSRIARHGIQLGAVPLRLHADIFLAVLSDCRSAQELADPDRKPCLLRHRRRQHGAGAAGLDLRQSVPGVAHRARAAGSPQGVAGDRRRRQSLRSRLLQIRHVPVAACRRCRRCAGLACAAGGARDPAADRHFVLHLPGHLLPHRRLPARNLSAPAATANSPPIIRCFRSSSPARSCAIARSSRRCSSAPSAA